MAQKYERKRYYVAPTEAMKEEAKRMNESSVSKTPGTKPLKSLLGENAPRLQVGSNQVNIKRFLCLDRSLKMFVCCCPTYPLKTCPTQIIVWDS